MTSSRRLLWSAAALGIALQQLRAAPLDDEECTKLNGERIQLEFAGVRANMAKGPEWAKANLPAESLGQIRRFLEVEAQILFRCRAGSLVNLPAEADPDPAAAARDEGEDGKDASGKAATPPPAPAIKKPGPGKKAATPSGPAPGGKAAGPAAGGKTPARQTKQEPGRAAPGKAPPKSSRAKVNDAYKPPPFDRNANPFAGQADPAAK